ncbi:MAG TPA: hypothetical protein VFF76_10515 [Holophagaceae bacterium]|jgi:hypothetical protein|nr:hypothetical protein [Holophagaceae bacterium]
MPARFRGALLAAPIFLLVACGGGSSSAGVNPTANDPKPTTSGVTANFDPSTGNIPLPNVLATAATTTTLVPTAHVPFTPPQALVWLNQQEAGNTNAVSGLNAPIYISFSGQVDPATVNASTVKVFMVVPDAPSNPSSTENNALGFVDVSAQFTYQVLPSGQEIYLMPQVPMLPGSRYLYVATNGVHDTKGIAIGSSLVFGIEKYVKGGATSYATDTTNIGDLTDPANPAAVLGQATATQLESIAGNVTVSGQIAFSGFRKTMWDLIAASATTGITSHAQIAVMGRTITNATGFTKPNPASTSALMPVETLLYAWANNANVGATDFSNASARHWSNGVANFQVIGSSAVPSGAGSVAAIFGGIPHSHVGTVSWGSFQSGDLQMDPATVQAHLAVAGGNEDGNSAYYPGNSAAPGTGTLMAFRSNTGQLFGYYHQTRTVPFVLVTPTTAAPAGGYPVVIFEHGIGRSKEDALAMADTAASVGYATIAIDQAVHGYDAGASGSLTAAGVTVGMGNGRPSAEWASNFFMLPSSLTARANLYTSAFHLWRLERVLNEPTADPTSLTAQLAAATASPTAFPFTSAPLSINTGPTTHRFVGQSLGSIVGTIFLAGNAGSTGGSNMPGFLSVPGARLAFVLHDSPAFQSAVNTGLAGNGVPTGSPAYNQFFLVAQSIADSADPATMMTPLPGATASRLAGRVAAQEAVGDLVIPNAEGNYWANALGGRTPQLGGDVSGGFTQILNDGQASVAVPFMFGTSYTTFKAAVAASNPAMSIAGPTQGVFQFGTTGTPANHGLLLDGSANTGPAQRQMAIWLATGKIADGADGSNGYPMAPPHVVPATELFGPDSLQLFFPKAQ